MDLYYDSPLHGEIMDSSDVIGSARCPALLLRINFPRNADRAADELFGIFFERNARINRDIHVTKQSADKKPLTELGCERTSGRQIVKKKDTAMSHLNLYLPDTLNILTTIYKAYTTDLKNQIIQIHSQNFSSKIGLAPDFRIGYRTTLE